MDFVLVGHRREYFLQVLDYIHFVLVHFLVLPLLQGSQNKSAHLLSATLCDPRRGFNRFLVPVCAMVFHTFNEKRHPARNQFKEIHILKRLCAGVMPSR